jgi:hypothetical protein
MKSPIENTNSSKTAQNLTFASTSTSTAPLGSCLLIDYRLSSKARLKNHLESTQLFETIEEPGSLNACLSIFAKRPVDTCVFGPSVKGYKIREFMGTLSLTARGSECAFIMARMGEGIESVSGVHSVIDFPCSQDTFNQEVVGALTKAHGGKLPEAKRYDRTSGKPVSLRKSIEQLEFPSHKTVTRVIQDTRSSLWPRETFDLVLRNSTALKVKLCDIQPFHLGFRTDGTPTEFTSKTVLEIIDSVFPNANTVPGMPKFKLVLEELLYKWAQTGTKLGRKTADTCLKREIINCFGLNIQ